MKFARFLSLGVLLATVLVSGAAPASAQSNSEVTVFAAASLTDAFNEIAAEYQYENPGSKVTFNFGGSNTLATQLNQGASADVFASADNTQMMMVQQGGDLTGDPQIFAHNLLTIITPSDNPQNVQGVCDRAAERAGRRVHADDAAERHQRRVRGRICRRGERQHRVAGIRCPPAGGQ